MKELALLFGIYAGVGLIGCVVLSFRKSKNSNAVKAIELFGLDSNPVVIFLGIALWPLWIFMQIVEQGVIQPKTEKSKTRLEEDLKK